MGMTAGRVEGPRFPRGLCQAELGAELGHREPAWLPGPVRGALDWAPAFGCWVRQGRALPLLAGGSRSSAFLRHQAAVRREKSPRIFRRIT